MAWWDDVGKAVGGAFTATVNTVAAVTSAVVNNPVTQAIASVAGPVAETVVRMGGNMAGNMIGISGAGDMAVGLIKEGTKAIFGEKPASPSGGNPSGNGGMGGGVQALPAQAYMISGNGSSGGIPFPAWSYLGAK